MPNAFLKVNIIVRIQGDFRGDLRRLTRSISTMKTLLFRNDQNYNTSCSKTGNRRPTAESSETSAEFSDLIRHVWYQNKA